MKGTARTMDFAVQDFVERRVKDWVDGALKWERAETTSLPNARSQSGASSAQIAAAQAVRDKLRDRWNQIYSLYENGRFRLAEVLQVARALGYRRVAPSPDVKAPSPWA